MIPQRIDTTPLQAGGDCADCHKDYCDCLRRSEQLAKAIAYNASIDEAKALGVLHLIQDHANGWKIDGGYWWYPASRKWKYGGTSR